MLFVAALLSIVTTAGCSTAGHPVANEREAMLGPEGTSIVPANRNPLTSDQIPNPCDIPKSVVERADLEPEGKLIDTEWWRFCGYSEGVTPWDGSFSVSTSITSFQETVEAKQDDNPSTIVIASRTAIQYYYDSGLRHPGCTIRWGTTYGTASVMYSVPSDTPKDWDACTRTRSVAEILAPAIPN
ncbi:hypothetical protein [Gordonia shandongensis]|uniref:hypothetical protein n=1 Tax=Gordonia shandongensis TaxID=376351 RepID=UPI003CCBDED8